MSAEQSRGLKRMRTKQGRGGPSYECDNCGMKRYAPCYCMTKGTRGHLPPSVRPANDVVEVAADGS